MMTLKELRLQKGLTQTQIADIIKSNAPTISLVENGQASLEIEDMILLEKEFSCRIAWNEDLTLRQKHETIQAVIDLSQRYPLPAVMSFANRMYRQMRNASEKIQFYAKISDSDTPEPLYPPDVCQTCH